MGDFGGECEYVIPHALVIEEGEPFLIKFVQTGDALAANASGLVCKLPDNVGDLPLHLNLRAKRHVQRAEAVKLVDACRDPSTGAPVPITAFNCNPRQ